MEILGTTSTIDALARAIDVSALRQSVYAANIANANVDGYHRMEVFFDREAERIALQMASASSRSIEMPSSQPSVVATSSSVKLDEEVAMMATNALRYQTLLGAFEKTMNLMRAAVKEGRE